MKRDETQNKTPVVDNPGGKPYFEVVSVVPKVVKEALPKGSPFGALKNLPPATRAVALTFTVFVSALIPITFAMRWLEAGGWPLGALIYAFTLAIGCIMYLSRKKEQPVEKKKD